MKEVEKLPLRDFTRYCMSIAQVPSSYLSGLTMEEQLLWLCSFLTNEVIPTVNNNGQAVEELQTLYIELKNYVDNYFDNLDIQEEVNTKLEDMAESGELAELISQYLEAQAIIGFNNNSSLATATNLSNGSFARTYGKVTYNDGQGAYYKIRTRLNSDEPDGDTLIALSNTENLVAEIIPYSRGYELKQEIDELKGINDITICQSDSYGNQQNEWCELLIAKLGLTLNVTGFNASVNGAGFSNSANSQFLTNLQTAVSSFTNEQKNNVKRIIVCGGYNDRDASQADIQTAIQSYINYCKTTFPNAKVYVGFIANDGTANQSNGGSTNIRDHFTLNVLPAYQNCKNYGGYYLTNVEYVMHNYELFMEDNVHPNEAGENVLANVIYQVLETGDCKITLPRINPTMQDKDGQAGIGGVMTVFMQFINNKINYFINGRYQPHIIEGVTNYTTTSGTEKTVPFPYFSSNPYLRRTNIFCFINLDITIEYTDNTIESNNGFLSPSTTNINGFNLTFTPHKTATIYRIWVNGVDEVDPIRF